jgi:hypothetical protein
VAAAGADDRELAFSPGVGATFPAALVPPGAEVCQASVEVASRFDAVEVVLGTYARPGPELAVTVREPASGRPLAAGVLPDGTRDNQSASARVTPEVPEGERVDVCFRNAGDRRVVFYGGAPADPLTDARVDGRPILHDIRLDYHRSQPRSALALVPDMFERAALFRPPGVGAWTYWCLLALVALGVPALLGAALRRALSR